MPAPPPPPKGGGMSLYANLLNPKADSSASVSGAPVLYDNGDKDDAAAKKEANPALRFQPIRRPQVNQKKPAKPAFPKAMPSSNATANSPPNENQDTTTTATPQPPRQTTSTPPPGHAPARTTLADWAAANDEDEYLWGAAAAEKRQRGGRRAAKKKKKQLAANHHHRETDWDEIYDPARPTNVDEYLRSDERVREVQEWKAVLYAHRRRDRRGRRGSYDDDEDSEEDSEVEGRVELRNQFAPPADYSFAPPPMSPTAAAAPSRDSPVAVPIPDDATGDDAYARRLALSGIGTIPPPTSHTPTPPPPPPPPPPPAEEETVAGMTISRGPVRYEAPPQASNPPPPPPEAMDLDDDDDDDDDEVNVDNIILPPTLGGLGANPNNNNTQQEGGEEEEGGDDSSDMRSNRPGQAGFARRLMSKYGWTAGAGLGASSSGIVKPLQVKVEKRRRRPDAEGGGFAEPGGRGKIIGGGKPQKNPTAAATTTTTTTTTTDQQQQQDPPSSEGKFGRMSEVVLLGNMLEGMPDLEAEVRDGGLGQEIGQECGDKYGRVERLHIDVPGRRVFIKFTDPVSALRAVNALEGRVFNGNTIAARFWDADKFERGEYDA